MAFAPINNTTQGSQNAIAPTIDSTGADFLILGVGWYAGINTDATGFVDSYSNTALYANATKFTTGTPTSVKIIYSNAAVTVGVGHTLTWTGANTFVGGNFSAWSGANVGSGILDNESGTTVTSTNVITLPSRTPSENNCLVVTALMFEDNSSGAIVTPSGFTLLGSVAWNGGSNEGFAMAYQIQTTATAVAPQWNTTNSPAAMAASMAIFKGPGGGGGATGQPTMRRWGGVPGVGSGSLKGNFGGGAWGRTRDGLIVPRRLAA